MKIRKAIIKDIPRVHRMINTFAGQNLLLPCSFSQLYEDIRDFWVCEKKRESFRLRRSPHILEGFGRNKVFGSYPARAKKGDWNKIS